MRKHEDEGQSCSENGDSWGSVVLQVLQQFDQGHGTLKHAHPSSPITTGLSDNFPPNALPAKIVATLAQAIHQALRAVWLELLVAIWDAKGPIQI